MCDTTKDILLKALAHVFLHEGDNLRDIAAYQKVHFEP
jgi:hypothetical protein